ncbi:MAG: glycoside-pentoside-hexuronide (GPH):cation symporter [Eubacteriales bacterium]|nr:glycoside-pentoside-hexuronide (GPH):cation symporter [Eubacteriales bacterium]
MEKNSRKQIMFYGVGTIGRDMAYSIVSMYLMYFLTDVMDLSVGAIAKITVIFMILRIFDAVNDPIMGVMVDRTRSKYGKFKPWLFFGAFASAVATTLLFVDYPVSENVYLVLFGLIYLFWDISYSAHDIPYWGMLPTLTRDQKLREKAGAFARICANIGAFSMAVGIVPITNALTKVFEPTHGLKAENMAYFVLALIISVLMVVFLLITVFFVKQNPSIKADNKQHSVKEMLKAVLANDQLLWIIVSMALFQIAYITTISMGLHYFEYILHDKDAYSGFAVILGIMQILALILLPQFTKRFTRKTVFTFGIILVSLGYIGLYFSLSIIPVYVSGLALFFGEGLIQLLMLMFITDCVEYGEWKLHQRNESITLSLQSFINKLGGSIATGITGFALILSGIKDEGHTADMVLPESGVLTFKTAMFVIPLLVIMLSYFLYRKKYIIDEKFYAKMVEEIENR